MSHLQFTTGQADQYSVLTAILAIREMKELQIAGAPISRKPLILVSDYSEMRRVLTGRLGAALFWKAVLDQSKKRVAELRERAKTDMAALLEIAQIVERMEQAVNELGVLNGE